MNHVPQATGCPHGPVEIQFLVTERFKQVIWAHEELNVSWESNESSDPILSVFYEKPARSELISGLDAILDFYQARSYFGLLAVFYSVSKRQFNLETYVDRKDDGHAVVTTKLLLAELYEIASADEHLNDDAKWQKYLQIDKMVQEAEHFTSQIQIFIYQNMMDFADSGTTYYRIYGTSRTYQRQQPCFMRL